MWPLRAEYGEVVGDVVPDEQLTTREPLDHVRERVIDVDDLGLLARDLPRDAD